MMNTYTLKVALLSDAAFSSGRGLPGDVDTEVCYDLLTGLPYIKGSVLKGLLVEACANLLYALNSPSDLVDAAAHMFGEAGSNHGAEGALIVDDARLPEVVAYGLHQKGGKYRGTVLATQRVLHALTDIRRQSARDPGTGAPRKATLRSLRVMRRTLAFYAPLKLHTDALHTDAQEARALLNACTATVRRGGLRRNRGLGHIRLSLMDNGQPDPFLDDFFAAPYFT